MHRLAIAIIATFLLAGCGLVPQLAGADGATVIASDKTIIDHVVSFTTGKNCSTLRSSQDLTYCEEDQVNPQPVLYCYRDLGKVSCYSQPDLQNRPPRVGQSDHNYVRKH